MKTKISLFALALCSTSVLADSWLYAGGQIGQSDIEGESDTTYGIHVGTGILPLIGIEAGYFNHGKVGLNLDGNRGDGDFSSLYLAIKPSIDLGPFHIYAKGGINAFDVDYKGTLSFLDKDDGVSYMYGVGAEYFVFDNLSIGASYQAFGVDIDSDSNSVDSFTGNVTFHFL
ncbi:OmpA-like transmembrane domain [Vibrio sp. B1FLJ16]|uniref:outer membrane beta-barrel protein n=1 Tax=Vibrio sp. B1FLJ16 TaxID=2751178 RepID=UPI0015F526F4|nr:outer membrane beta-barrel protein [Vibrio sp. B1FLJ16]CAD7806269.1 OmpA-like transmembrane domain [Vibrio sp. B1FLJ16]CAE6901765.1 OmpA-like transmembrane domain [Vibrio sp. B1FLJ16]